MPETQRRNTLDRISSEPLVSAMVVELEQRCQELTRHITEQDTRIRYLERERDYFCSWSNTHEECRDTLEWWMSIYRIAIVGLTMVVIGLITLITWRW